MSPTIGEKDVKLIIVALSIVLIMGIGTGSALAQQNSLKEGVIGFSVGLGNSVFGDTYDSVIDVTGKYLISNELALLAGIGSRHTVEMQTAHI